MTYDEIQSAASDDSLRRRVRVAIVVAAELIRVESDQTANHAARVVWAKDGFIKPNDLLDRMVWAVLAQNRASTLATVLGASDSIVQSAVNTAVNAFI